MRLSQNDSMPSEGPDHLMPPRHHSAHRENCRMKWTIYKVKSDNSYDNHREKHKRNQAATLPTTALPTIMFPT